MAGGASGVYLAVTLYCTSAEFVEFAYTMMDLWRRSGNIKIVGWHAEWRESEASCAMFVRSAHTSAKVLERVAQMSVVRAT